MPKQDQLLPEKAWTSFINSGPAIRTLLEHSRVLFTPEYQPVQLLWDDNEEGRMTLWRRACSWGHDPLAKQQKAALHS